MSKALRAVIGNLQEEERRPAVRAGEKMVALAGESCSSWAFRHAVYVSQPEIVADLIALAADGGR
jgi:hypothetical protein